MLYHWTPGRLTVWPTAVNIQAPRSTRWHWVAAQRITWIYKISKCISNYIKKQADTTLNVYHRLWRSRHSFYYFIVICIIIVCWLLYSYLYQKYIHLFCIQISEGTTRCPIIVNKYTHTINYYILNIIILYHILYWSGILIPIF